MGSGTYGLQTLPPGINCYDAASIARSQHDLRYPATPQWTPRARGYVTTLEMRRKGSAPGPYPRLQHAGGSQPTLADVWATPCPVHGPYGQHHHVYDAPLFDDDDDGAARPAAAGDGGVASPFYHELDGPGLQPVVEGPTPPPRPVAD